MGMKSLYVYGMTATAIMLAPFAFANSAADDAASEQADQADQGGGGPGHGGPGHGGPGHGGPGHGGPGHGGPGHGGPGHGGPGHGGPGHGGPGHWPPPPPHPHPVPYPVPHPVPVPYPVPAPYPPYPAPVPYPVPAPIPAPYPNGGYLAQEIYSHAQRLDNLVQASWLSYSLKSAVRSFLDASYRYATCSYSCDYARNEVVNDWNTAEYYLRDTYNEPYIYQEYQTTDALVRRIEYGNPNPYPDPYPNPNPYQYLCTVTTGYGSYRGVGPSIGSATADARNSCMRVETSFSCNAGSVTCRNY